MPQSERRERERPGALADEPRGSKRGAMFNQRKQEREKWLRSGAKGFPGEESGRQGSKDDGQNPRKARKTEDGGPLLLGSSQAPFQADSDTVKEVPWVCRGLRVRVVDDEGPLQSSHLKKGFVQNVDSSSLCADVSIDGGSLLRAVPQRCLETVVSKGCSRVEVVRGPNKGVVAELLERDPKKNIAVILAKANQVKGNVEGRLELSLDDVCEFQ